MKRRIGCLADDFTGAGDAASFLADSGLKTVLYNGLPPAVDDADWEALVIALKTRTLPAQEAVAQSLAAYRALAAAGAETIFSKYCSTFDSTDQGNIGPVLDALLAEMDETYTILSPALLENGRRVTEGILYVNGVPLGESPMKDHPLTPMRDSSLQLLMEAQSKYRAHPLPREIMAHPTALAEFIAERQREEKHFYLIPDYDRPEDGELIARSFGQSPLLSGSSGLLSALAREWGYTQAQGSVTYEAVQGQSLVLAGSCSVATRKQIAAFEALHPAIQLDPIALHRGEVSVEDTLASIQSYGAEPVLIYSSGDPAAVQRVRAYGEERNLAIADIIEGFMAQLVAAAVGAGIRKLVVAGGETSGAVTKGLGFRGYQLGPTIQPGIPLLIPLENERMRLVLKSGNFGDEQFFIKATE